MDLHGRIRRNDYETSIEAAVSIFESAKSQQQRLLGVYKRHPEGLLDDEAGHMAGLDQACFWKRCGELREMGLIMWDEDQYGKILKRESPFTGRKRGICVITGDGEKHYWD